MRFCNFFGPKSNFDPLFLLSPFPICQMRKGKCVGHRFCSQSEIGNLTGEQAGDETYEGGTTTINSYIRSMKDVRITAVRKVLHQDLVAKYENPIEHACDVHEGQVWISVGGKCPADFCPEAWKTIREYVEVLACGGGNFFDGWMKNPHSALLSCNDGFRPVSFLLETVE